MNLFIQKVSFVSLCQVAVSPEIFVKQGFKDFFIALQGTQAYFQVHIQSWKKKSTAVS